jgi:brefeldin A-inhibited guanine nucleotide-exchange protein
MSSLSFVASSLDAIATSKEAQRNKQLGEYARTALAAIKEREPELPEPEIIFAPLQLAAKSPNAQLTTTALDCIGKLISYSYFTAVDAAEPAEDGTTTKTPLIERAIDTICDCFQGETTPVEVQLQIVKSLLAAVLNDKIVVHGAGLLKAVRQIYNVFLLSRNTTNQQIAQGTLTQMVGTVFERVKTRLHMKEARINQSRQDRNYTDRADDDAESPQDENDEDPQQEEQADEASRSPDANKEEAEAKLTLKDLEHRKSFDDTHMGDGPTMVTQLKTAKKKARSISDQSTAESAPEDSPEALDAEDEVYIRDAYLVIRAFCNLATKVLPPEQLYDMRSQAMRSKLVSLHLIHTLMNNHVEVFTSPLCKIKNSKSNEFTSFLQAIKYYICLTITRNGASSVDRVFDVTAEIFWLILKFMRPSFKVRGSSISALYACLTMCCRKRSRFSSTKYTSLSSLGEPRRRRRSCTSSTYSVACAPIRVHSSRSTLITIATATSTTSSRQP